MDQQRPTPSSEAITGEPTPAGGGVTDYELIQASIETPARFGVIYQRRHHATHAYLHRRSPANTADELTQQTFTVAFEIRARYAPRHPTALPWLIGIARNQLRHHTRAEHRRHRLTAKLPTPPDEPDPVTRLVDLLHADALGGDLHDALDAISDDERLTLMLTALEDHTYQEAAHALEVPVGTIRSRLNRIRRNLAIALHPANRRRQR